jgi:regulator of RNase E activity RraA
MPKNPPPDSFRERLARLDTCVVSDALDRLGLAGVVTGIPRLSTDRAIAGRAVTVKLERPNGRVPVTLSWWSSAPFRRAPVGVVSSPSPQSKEMLRE